MARPANVKDLHRKAEKHSQILEDHFASIITNRRIGAAAILLSSISIFLNFYL